MQVTHADPPPHSTIHCLACLTRARSILPAFTKSTTCLSSARSILTDAARYAVRIGVVPPRIDIGYTELARWTADARRQARGRHIPTSATHNATRGTCHRNIRPDAAQNTRRLTRARSILTDAARYAVRIGVVPPRFDIGYTELARWTANARRQARRRHIPTSVTHNAARRTCHRDIPSDAAQNTRRRTRGRSILTDAARYAVRIGVVHPQFDIGYAELARWTADARRQAREQKHTDLGHTQCNSWHLSPRYTSRRRTKYTSSDPCSIHTYRRRKICSPYRCRASAVRYRIRRTCPMDSQCTTSVQKSKHTDPRHTQCNSSHLSSRYTFRRRTKYTSSDPCSIHTYRRRKICSPYRCRASADRYRIHRTCPMDSPMSLT